MPSDRVQQTFHDRYSANVLATGRLFESSRVLEAYDSDGDQLTLIDIIN